MWSIPKEIKREKVKRFVTKYQKSQIVINGINGILKILKYDDIYYKNFKIKVDKRSYLYVNYNYKIEQKDLSE